MHSSSSRRSPKGMHESDLRNSSIGQKTAAKLTTLHVRIKEGIDGEEFNAFIDDIIRAGESKIARMNFPPLIERQEDTKK